MPIRNEVSWGSDDFNKPVELSRKDSIAQIVLNLFLLRPGNYPSMPHIGLNIRQYMYQQVTDVIQEEIKQNIVDQCSEIISDVKVADIRVVNVPDKEGQGVLIILIPLEIEDSKDNVLVYGFQVDTAKQQLLYNYQFDTMSAT